MGVFLGFARYPLRATVSFFLRPEYLSLMSHHLVDHLCFDRDVCPNLGIFIISSCLNLTGLLTKKTLTGLESKLFTQYS